ncbi:hypothetical protein LOZ57_000360 [Ophidiomyces ophidiicola]|uniref:uncharacterized protein n=1 Tax=Ophidiomyces ophidiicola TaxID=1387563 RepID=UPI0020C40B4D|nr:uncharacterized protein LOZ57_000360 [Ophidiomyces ophidiicola]KAI1954016.1 hypothetical protein LOZ57_000360 [Ophidiomyces ophidiicola]KAI2058344.1 hypothetical protein LOZ43_002640 [Ophidiomyces ophidiicola]
MSRSILERLVNPRRSYERVAEEDGEERLDEYATPEEPPVAPFSRLEYVIFLWLGVSMLWAWNMFLAAAPYFQRRFGSNPWIRSNFQSCILSVSCLTNLSSALILAKLQENASYPRRIRISILLNIAVFALLAISTVMFRNISSLVYFVFVLAMVFIASLATGMSQNGLFAYVTGFGRSEYTQGIMVGQGISGVLPCIVQMLAVLAVPDASETLDLDTVEYQSAKSAFIYFTAAVGVSGLAFFAFLYLNGSKGFHRITDESPLHLDEDETLNKKSIPLRLLFRKLRWISLGILICFAITMAFPVFTVEIHSIRESGTPAPPRIFQSAVFIPLAFLFWNTGDLIGRTSAGISCFKKASRYPFLLFAGSLMRILFIPMYLMCNIRGQGAKINSDFYYLFVVQFMFGLTSGYLCSACMIGAAAWVDEDEREAAGGFMSLMLAAGLATGSLLSFLVAKL